MRHVTIRFLPSGGYLWGIPHEDSECWPGGPPGWHCMSAVPVDDDDMPDERAVENLRQESA